MLEKTYPYKGREITVAEMVSLAGGSISVGAMRWRASRHGAEKAIEMGNGRICRGGIRRLNTLFFRWKGKDWPSAELYETTKKMVSHGCFHKKCKKSVLAALDAANGINRPKNEAYVAEKPNYANTMPIFAARQQSEAYGIKSLIGMR